MNKLLVVDGNSLLNRAYYGVRPLTTKEGLYTNAVYGMVTILLKILDTVSPDICCIAFDRKEPTFRHKEYAEYKAGRHAMPDELRMQFPYAKDVCAAMGFTVTDCAGWEADDILGTLSKEAADAGCEAYLLTGDRDSLQLIGDSVTVLLETNKGTVTYDRAQFLADYGVPPEHFVDVKALMGDSSDNIPGVPGIGEKTALKLIADCETLDALYENIEEKGLKAGVLSKLTEGHDSAFFSRRLATIVRDAPLDVHFSDLPTKADKEDLPALRELFVKLEFSAFIKRMNLDEAVSAAKAAEAAEEAPAEAVPEREADVSVLCALPVGDPVSVVPVPEEGLLYVRTKDALYVSHPGDFSAFADFLSDENRTFLVYDAKTLYHLLKKYGMEPFEAGFDVMLAGYVLDPAAGGYTPDKLALKYLGAVVPEDVSGAALAHLVWNLYPKLLSALRETGSENLYASIELPLARVLFRMEERGFQVDTDGIRAFGERLGAECERYLANIYKAAGTEFNVNSPKQLGEVLFDRMGLPCPGSKRSTNAEVLEKLRPYAPIVGDILDYRQVMKLRSTYTEGLLKVADENGRVHSSFNQTVTATGRLSSTEPNLQNIPVRTELGRELRRYFIPCDKNHILLDADYSQIELRLLAAISGDEAMIEAFRSGTDIHAVTASQVFRVPLHDVTPELRKRAKAVNFGIVYGIGDYSLAQDIGVTKKQAGAYIESYLQTYPKVSAYLSDAVKRAKENGYVTTIFGRRRYIPELSSTKKMIAAFGERVAMNSPIQGSAADIIKAAMISLDRELEKSGLDAHLILQVHDELIVECSKDCADKAAEILRREMEHTVELAVPLTVDVSAGETWYDGH